MKKFLKWIIVTSLQMIFITIIENAGEQVGKLVGQLIGEGIDEIPEELDKVKDFTKRVILKEQMFLKKVRDKIIGFYHPVVEKDIVLDKDDEEILKDIEKEVSQL